jgi:mRNA-degrading endonuclease toxin of MazEF toxin-antitoxin module
MNKGDIYLISLDPTLGHEQQGKHPVLVISPEPFNRITKMTIVLPITSGGRFARNSGFTVEITGGKTTGVVRCDQPRALDFDARHAKRLESVDSDVLDEVMARFNAIFEE